MKYIKITYGSVADWNREDCERIRRILTSKGYICTLEQAQTLWGLHSERYGAEWETISANDESIFRCVKPFFEEADADRSGEYVAAETLAMIYAAADGAIRETPRLPCSVSEMTPREFEIFQSVAALLGSLSFIRDTAEARRLNLEAGEGEK